MKTVIVAIVICVFVAVNLFPSMTLKHVECIDDYAQDFTSPVNTYFIENPESRNAMLISAGIMSDLITLGALGYWTFSGRSWRLPIALACTYALKAVCVALFRVRYPEGYAWKYPGFYSLTVNYGMANDFHFTVHVSLMLIIF